jgi:hypothetical protein
LHWLTLTGSAAVTVELVSMEHVMPPPPPVTEPLHWLTGAPLVLAIVQRSAVPAPLDPTHWFSVAGVTAELLGLMWLWMMTLQMTTAADCVADPLHWSTFVTRFGDVEETAVPLHGFRLQTRETVVRELVTPLDT